MVFGQNKNTHNQNPSFSSIFITSCGEILSLKSIASIPFNTFFIPGDTPILE